MFDYMIYRMAKKIGQSEQFVMDNYNYTQIAERNLFDNWDVYAQNEMDKSS